MWKIFLLGSAVDTSVVTASPFLSAGLPLLIRSRFFHCFKGNLRVQNTAKCELSLLYQKIIFLTRWETKGQSAQGVQYKAVTSPSSLKCVLSFVFCN